MTHTKTSSSGGRLVGWRIAAWTGAGLILLLPLAAMQFTSEVRWTAFDFAVAGGLLAFLVGSFEVVVRLSGDWAYRAAVGVAAAATFGMIWVQGAVGLVGSENDLFNLLFLTPLLVGAAGCFISGFRASGMAQTLIAMAVLQAATLAIGFAVTRDEDAVLIGVWVVAWALSAWLFGRAAKRGAA